MSRFEPWTRGALTGISSMRIAPRWVRIGVIICLGLRRRVEHRRRQRRAGYIDHTRAER